MKLAHGRSPPNIKRTISYKYSGDCKNKRWQALNFIKFNGIVTQNMKFNDILGHSKKYNGANIQRKRTKEERRHKYEAWIYVKSAEQGERGFVCCHRNCYSFLWDTPGEGRCLRWPQKRPLSLLLIHTAKGYQTTQMYSKHRPFIWIQDKVKAMLAAVYVCNHPVLSCTISPELLHFKGN